MEDLKVKKYLALLLALVMVFALAACGSTAETPAATEAPAAEPETPAEEPAAEADPMEDLIAAAKAEGELTVYGSCEEEYLAAACQHFQELYGIKVNYQRLSTGEVQAKIEEENGNPSADVLIPTSVVRKNSKQTTVIRFGTITVDYK